MKKIHFHAGFPKCGSTAIQTACFAHSKQLADAKIYYPDNLPHISSIASDAVRGLRRKAAEKKGLTLFEAPWEQQGAQAAGMNHRALRLALLPEPGTPGPSELFKNVLAQFEASEADTLLLSCEGFAMAPERFDPSRLPDLSAYEVEISYIIRPLPQYVNSIYKQKVTDAARFSDNINDFIRNRGRILFPSPRIISQFAKFVGARKLHIGHLDDGGNALSILGDFLRFPLDVLPTSPKNLTDKKGRTNVSLSNVSALYCAELNRQDADHHIFKSVVVALEIADKEIKEISPINLLTETQKRRFTHIHNNHVDRLNTIYSANLPKISAPPPSEFPVLQVLDRKRFETVTDMIAADLDPEIVEALNATARRLA